MRPLIHVLIVAPYASVRAGLRSLVTEGADCDVVGEARDVASLQHLLPALAPGVIVYDESAGPIGEILASAQEAECAVVGLCETQSAIFSVAQSTLRGWAILLPSASGDEIVAAIRGVDAGLLIIDRTFSSVLARGGLYPETAAEDLLPLEDMLTPRENEVLELMARGLANKNIAARLGISLSTVKFHVASILSKLEAASRTEAVTTGARRGLIAL